jgi:uncharacterized protein HemX
MAEREAERALLAPTIIVVLTTMCIALAGVGLFEMRQRLGRAEDQQAEHEKTTGHHETNRVITRIEAKLEGVQGEQARQALEIEKLRAQQHSNTERIIREINRRVR